MLVQVLETGPDGAGTVIWDTDIMRTLGIWDEWNDGCDLLDCAAFADTLEKGDDIEGTEYARSYTLHDDFFKVAISKAQRFDKEITCYCD